MADILDLQASVVNLSLSSDRTSPGIDSDQENRDPASLERPGSFQSWLHHTNSADNHNHDSSPPQRTALSSASSLLNTPPRKHYDVSPFQTPGSDVSSFDRFYGALPPRSASTRASPAASSGKYVPPRLRQQLSAAPSPESVSSRYTPPVSPLMGPASPLDSSPPSAFSLRSPGLPPTGRNDPRLGDRYSTPRKGYSDLSPFQTSQADNLLHSEPSTPASLPSRHKEAVTPSSDLGCTPYRGSTVTPVSKNPAAASRTYKSAPTTPEAALLHYNPELSRTAVKRIIHDAKNPNLTFNQKKHRSPSHLRRSERRQQERAAKEASFGTPTVDKENLPENYADPWEEGSKSVSSKAPTPKAMCQEGVQTSTALPFVPSATKAKAMR